MSAEIGDGVAVGGHEARQVLLELEPGVIGGDGDAHLRRLTGPGAGPP